MNELDTIRTFLAIYETGSFTQAANRQAITKSVASRRLTALEAELDVRLLTRNTRGVIPTPAGVTFYEEAQRIVADLEDVKDSMRAERQGLAGPIRISAPKSFGRTFIQPTLLQIMKDNPKITLDASFSDRSVDLAGEGYDLGLRIGRLKDSSLIARKLASIRLVMVASPAYLQEFGEPKTPQDLKNHNCAIYTNAMEAHSWRLGPDTNPQMVRVNGNLKTNSGDMQVAACLAGQALISIPYFYVHHHIKAGTLKPVLCEYRSDPLGLYAVYPASRHVTGRVRLLIDILADRFSQPEFLKIM
ncbi:LysR family transcriptional regulator [Paremcibacter congregatus]|jgi:DNA-binding transcriptional LysR family regulator|uniref:LysR family transcriptional regulator n=1 Tax=Paremcibacter congregatus TaxID=2043170 RepID=A0A2G4YRW7_9PROT|nr:LysR family transcriptional regulator [Paremcibacter congregatus]PHZ84196.1 LysR family transcriptional regulator [Paremcibacter congregatus]QDE29069.1 LysR family transcriptional regulator [Paremcibacter congregatus]|tara:strand:+ start:3499 stop:4404 length:906 start_codon:yes stop_codon:yes gene_type:complete